ncbi:MAG: GTP cyclohydrolase I FolE [Holosporaceae bacterium]|jgi:GTP cyclohydrolase I|nr:GTP cyclohydrolase I FolE [Holosporaceae bacterium]
MNIEKHIEAIIKAIDPDAHDLQQTPARVSDAFGELYSGYKHNLKDTVSVLYNSEMDEMVMLKNIPFESNCEHHLMPMIGEVSIGYLPCGKIIGLSKLARIVDCYAHRMQLQERFTMEVAHCVNSIIEPQGVAVYVRAEHFCLTHRGVKKTGTSCVTKYFLGKIKQNPELRREFLAEINAT